MVSTLDSYNSTPTAIQKPKIFYGWYLVTVDLLAQVNCAFHMSSTLSVFLKPLTEDLAVSRGLFSMLRSGEILLAGALAPLIGPLVDRYGGRWLMAGGALSAGIGFVLLSQASAFWQFLLVRWVFVAIGGVLMCQMVVSVTISRWFVRKRGRAIAIASLGQGSAKVLIPIVTATLFVWVGWRSTWAIFGLLTLVLVVIPAAVFMRRSPEEMGLMPDGADAPAQSGAVVERKRATEAARRGAQDEVVWSRREIIGTRTFWIICFMYGMANVGIAGLNLHVFAYVTDIGFSAMVAATTLTIIASTQLGSTLIWGFISERIEIRHSSTMMFLIQALGLALTIASASWSLGTVYAKRHPTQASPYMGAAFQMIVGGTAVALVGTVLGEWASWHLSSRGIGAIAYLVIFGSILGYSAYSYALRHASATIVGTYAYVNPVIAVVLGWLLLHEPVGARTFVAMGLILVAVIWIQFSLKARRTDNASTVRRSDSPTVRPEPEAST